LFPIILSEESYIRVGSENDGGYVLPSIVFSDSDYLLSGGIERNNDFELQIADRGIEGAQYDNSINTPPVSHELLSFHRSTLGGSKEKGHMTFEQILVNSRAKKIILKLDIEGSEFEFLSNAKSFNNFSAIIIEFHKLNRITESDFFDKFSDILKSINIDLVPVNLHANNCCGLSILGGIPVPRVLEVTWLSRKYLSKVEVIEKAMSFSMLNKSNLPNRDPLDISHFLRA
jgi:hypothetical protein